MSAEARANIDTGALRHNLREARALAPNARVMAVIKANAYGHGIESVARALDEADAFGVARLREAVAVREAGATVPVVLLEGAVDVEELAAAAQLNLDVVVHRSAQFEMLEGFSGAPVRVWLKLETGMNRLGLPLAALDDAWRRLQSCPAVRGRPILMTHLANADLRDEVTTQAQCQRFNDATGELAAERSIANSAGLLAYPTAHGDWIRPGLMLYGVSPFADETGQDLGLRPAMRFQSRLISVRTISAGERVGYGGHWRALRETRLGVAAAGYGDGYPRHLGNGTPVLVNGRLARLAGTVSMDMIAIDLGEGDAAIDAEVGDEVLLWGTGLPVEIIARHAQTIPYELLCRIAQRVAMEYS